MSCMSCRLSSSLGFQADLRHLRLGSKKTQHGSKRIVSRQIPKHQMKHPWEHSTHHCMTQIQQYEVPSVPPQTRRHSSRWIHRFHTWSPVLMDVLLWSMRFPDCWSTIAIISFTTRVDHSTSAGWLVITSAGVVWWFSCCQDGPNWGYNWSISWYL